MIFWNIRFRLNRNSFSRDGMQLGLHVRTGLDDPADLRQQIVFGDLVLFVAGAGNIIDQVAGFFLGKHGNKVLKG